MKICPICASQNISSIAELFDQSIDTGDVNLDWCHNCGTLVRDNYLPTQVIHSTMQGRLLECKKLPLFVVDRVLKVKESSIDEPLDEWIPVHVATV